MIIIPSKYLRAVLVTAMLSAGVILSAQAAPANDKELPTFIYFHSLTCHRCAQTKANVMPKAEKFFAGRVKFEYKDISDVENYKTLFTLKQRLGADEKSVFPVMYFNGSFLDGRNERNLTYESIATFIARGMGADGKLPASAKAEEIHKYFRKITPFAIMSAGFVDGINPCAFTVIVFFMSFLFFQGYGRRNMAIVGGSFMVAVFTTYVLIGFGLFGWLHVMKPFQLASKIISITIGVASIIFGILSIYDAFVFRKRGESDDMVLHLPKSVKAKIQGVIGERYRLSKDKEPHKNVFMLIGSALATGFIISIFESLCTGQLYLPTIMYILKTSHDKALAFTYLILYNLMFMVPIGIIYCMALAGVTSQTFGAFMKKHMFLVKMFLAAMFLFLGISLVHADGDSTRYTDRPQAEVKKDPNSFDFGKVKEGDIIKHTFMLKNSEDVPINIKEVNTSCACTNTKVEKKVVMPGEEVPIEMSFNTKGYPGARKRHLFVHTDSKKNALVIFEITADVQ